MKNLLLSAAMVCATTSLFAQLYVTPTGSDPMVDTDSYIYVDNQVLFVEQDIQLVENTIDPTTKASIYIRNRGQLMQGTTSSANSGTGYISIFQDSNSDAYDYNYWCSPVGFMATAVGNRNFGFARVHDSITQTQSFATQLTGGVNGSSSPLTISTRWTHSWDPLAQSWFPVGSATQNLVPPGYGFIMKGTDVSVHTNPFGDPQNQRYDFRGRPNNGDITMPVSYNAVTQHYTLTGNPYPSALDLKEVFYDTDNTEIDSFRYWDEDRSINSHYYIANKGGYGSWIPGPEADDANPGTYTRPTFYNYDNGGGQGTSTGVMGATFERRYAPIGQGFMIVANTSGNITIKNEHRQFVREGVAQDSQFRNPNSGGDASASVSGAGIPVNNENLTPQIRVVTVFGENSHMRDMVLMFHDTATDGYDRGMDATHPMDADAAEAYFPIDQGLDTERDLVIQTVPFVPTKRVPMAFELEEETTFFVQAVEQINTPFEKAYLFDSSNGSYQEITHDETASLLLPAGVYEDRFFITFRGNFNDDSPVNTLVAERQKRLLETVEFVQNNPIAKLEVSNPEGYDIQSVQIYDMSGKLVLNQANLGTQSRLSFPTANFSDGVYLVKLLTTDNLSMDYKITVNNK